MQTKIPKTQKRFVYNTSTGEYESNITGCGVPSVPYIINLASVSTSNWNSSWQIPLGCRAVRISKRGKNNSYRVSADAAGATYITVGGTEVFDLGEMFGPEDPTVLYFQCVTAPDTIEIMYWLDGSECHTP